MEHKNGNGNDSINACDACGVKYKPNNSNLGDYNLCESCNDINNQLMKFGHIESNIIKAIKNVNNKKDVNEIIEYLEKNQTFSSDELKVNDINSSESTSWNYQCSPFIMKQDEHKHHSDESKDGDIETLQLFAEISFLWPNNKTLKVCFIDYDKPKSTENISLIMNANKEFREKILNVVRNNWSKCLNIKFEETVDIASSNIRISFVKGSSASSAVGSNADNYPTKATMKFGYKRKGIFKTGTVLHEFGHALSFKHEHCHPVEQIPYNKDAVYKYYSSHGWKKDKVDHNVLNRPDPATVTGYDDTIDKDSIMRYKIKPSLLNENSRNYKKFTEYNYRKNTLSDIDKQKSYRFYPFYYPNIGQKVQVFSKKEVEESFKMAMRDKDIIESYKYCRTKGIVIQHHATNGVKVEFDDNNKKISYWYEPIGVRMFDEIKPGFKVQIKTADYIKTENAKYADHQGIVKEIDENKGVKIQFIDDKELWFELISFEIIDYIAIDTEISTLESAKLIEKAFDIVGEKYIWTKNKEIYTTYINATGTIKERHLRHGIKVQFADNKEAWYISLALIQNVNRDKYYKEIETEQRFFVNDWVKNIQSDIVGTVEFNDGNKIEEHEISVKIDNGPKTDVYHGKMLIKLASNEIWYQKKKIAGLSSYIDFSNKDWKCHGDIKIVKNEMHDVVYNSYYKHSWKFKSKQSKLTVTFNILKHWDIDNGDIILKLVHLSSYTQNNPGHHSPINIYVNNVSFREDFIPKSNGYITNKFTFDSKQLKYDKENTLKIEAAKNGYKNTYWIQKLCICYEPKLK